MHYNSFEKAIANFLSNFPRVKQIAKRSYQHLQYYMNRPGVNMDTNWSIKRLSLDGCESFFGYYDVCPMSLDGDLILFHSYHGDSSRDSLTEAKIDIVVYYLGSDNYHIVSETNAFNWQQGSRLQWIDHDHFAFNRYDLSQGDYKSAIYCVDKTGINFRRELPFPIYDCNGSKAVTLSFERLAICDPDYGYFASKHKLKEDSEDGIWLFDTLTGDGSQVLSIRALSKFQRKVKVTESYHHVNHLMLSPNGKKLLFIHRWRERGIRRDRLLVMDLHTTEFSVVADKGMVSHCCWLNDDSIIAYLRGNSGYNAYHQIDLSGETIVQHEIGVGRNLLRIGDGHPSVFVNKLLIDTYPNKSRLQELYVLELSSNEMMKVGSFLSPIRYYGMHRCDLHPKWGRDNQTIFIDSTHEGRRNFFMLSSHSTYH